MQGDLFTTDAYGTPTAQPIQPKPTGEELRDRALARVRDAAPPEWVESAWCAIRLLCGCKSFFTTDEVWSICGTKPPEPRALGAVMREAATKGMIRKTDRVQPSVRPECHRRPVAVWEVCA